MRCTVLPEFPDYTIYEDGKIFSHRRSKFMKTNTTSGYHKVGLVTLEGRLKSSIGLHKLLALAFVPNPYSKPIVDHIDRNKLNNNLNNLRWVTQQGNSQNASPRQNASSKYLGVHLDKRTSRWRAVIRVNHKRHYLGGYETELEAHKAYMDAKAIHHIDVVGSFVAWIWRCRLWTAQKNPIQLRMRFFYVVIDSSYIISLSRL